jgi:zinc transport system substrate-binding protein
MFKIIFINIFILNTIILANINVIVSILPQKNFVKNIGGDKVDITFMVKPGSSPHTYEPKPTQMKAVSKADIYFSIGVEFENVWLDKFKAQNKNMIIVDVGKNIKKLDIDENMKHDEDDIKDPHIWTSPNNIKIIAKNILNTLIKYDIPNTTYYKNNYNKFIQKIDKIDNQIKNIFNKMSKKPTFLVFHPAWAYYASYYGLKQISVEIGGKNPKPKSIIKIIKIAKQNHIKAIFVSPEFSTKSAKLIANELNIEVIKISPLEYNWSNNLLILTKSLQKLNY